MKFTAALTLLAAASAMAVPVEDSAQANLPGLNSVQSAHARAIIAQTRAENFGGNARHACETAIATGLTEASMLVYANSNVPASYNYPHDRVGSDHDSVGIFQQRVSIYKNIAADMDPARSAGQFYAEMKRISNWPNIAVGKLCQKVQRSAYPDRYNANVGKASNICSAGGI